MENVLGRCPLLALYLEMHLDSFGNFKVFLGIPEMQYSKVSPTKMESCPNPNMILCTVDVLGFGILCTGIY